MTAVRASISTSLDGFVAGPNDSRENPLGDGGEWLDDLASGRERHGRAGDETNVDDGIFARAMANAGAIVMGRR